MDEAKIAERFNQLEKRVSDGFVRMEDSFARLEILIETLANNRGDRSGTDHWGKRRAVSGTAPAPRD